MGRMGLPKPVTSYTGAEAIWETADYTSDYIPCVKGAFRSVFQDVAGAVMETSGCRTSKVDETTGPNKDIAG